MKRFRERIKQIQIKRSKAEKERLAHEVLLQQAQEKAHREAADIDIPGDLAEDVENNLDNQDQTVPHQTTKYNFELVFESQLITNSDDDTNWDPIDLTNVKLTPVVQDPTPSETATDTAAASTPVPPSPIKTNNNTKSSSTTNSINSKHDTPHQTKTTSIFGICNVDSQMTTQARDRKITECKLIGICRSTVF